MFLILLIKLIVRLTNIRKIVMEKSLFLAQEKPEEAHLVLRF